MLYKLHKSRPFLGHIQVLQGVTQKRTNAQVFIAYKQLLDGCKVVWPLMCQTRHPPLYHYFFIRMKRRLKHFSFIIFWCFENLKASQKKNLLKYLKSFLKKKMLNRYSHFSKISKFIVNAFPRCRLVLSQRLLLEQLSSPILTLRINSVIVYYLHLSIRILKNQKLKNSREALLSFGHIQDCFR